MFSLPDWFAVPRPFFAISPALFLIVPLSVATLIGCALPPPPDSVPVAGVRAEELTVANLVERGIAAFRAGNDDEAVELFRSAHLLAPDSLPVSRNLGTALLQTGAFEEADILFSQLVTQRPKDPSPLFLRANARRGRRAFREALADYRHALMLAEERGDDDELTASVGRTLADTLFLVGLTTESRCVSERVLAFAPGRDDLRRHARLLRGLRLYQSAKILIEGRVSAAELTQEPSLLFELAIAEYGIGDRAAFEMRRDEALAAAEGNILLRQQFEGVFSLTKGVAESTEEEAEGSKLKGEAFIKAELNYLPEDIVERWLEREAKIAQKVET